MPFIFLNFSFSTKARSLIGLARPHAHVWTNHDCKVDPILWLTQPWLLFHPEMEVGLGMVCGEQFYKGHRVLGTAVVMSNTTHSKCS